MGLQHSAYKILIKTIEVQTIKRTEISKCNNEKEKKPENMNGNNQSQNNNKKVSMKGCVCL
jgi:hypothetical protein